MNEKMTQNPELQLPEGHGHRRRLTHALPIHIVGVGVLDDPAERTDVIANLRRIRRIFKHSVILSGARQRGVEGS